jgi:demethylmenaquinone methyltransferase/2-methoxy-6-polyprenyl-1,4-benzoquinol methylase
MDQLSINLDSDAKMLYYMEPLRRMLVQAIITALQLPRGSRGLDVGCGLGLQTQMLAQAVGPEGHVTGMDYSKSLLQFACMFARATGLSGRLAFLQGSWNQIAYREATFDWVWSMDAAGYALFNDQATPENHYLRTTGWMRQVGLCDVRTETFVQTISAPLDMEHRNALAELFSMRWGTARSDVSPEDWQAYLRLCKASSVDFIGDNPDYYAFFTYSVFSGTVSER